MKYQFTASIHIAKSLKANSKSQNLSKSMTAPTHSRTKKHENLTKPIRNAGFVVIRRLGAFNKVRQNFNLAFEMKKVNTKYKVLAMWLTEGFIFQKPHYA